MIKQYERMSTDISGPRGSKNSISFSHAFSRHCRFPCQNALTGFSFKVPSLGKESSVSFLPVRGTHPWRRGWAVRLVIVTRGCGSRAKKWNKLEGQASASRNWTSLPSLAQPGTLHITKQRTRFVFYFIFRYSPQPFSRRVEAIFSQTRLVQ